MNRQLFASAVMLACVLGGSPANAGISTATATLAPPMNYHGKCPAPLIFTGRVAVSGALDAQHPAKIAYHFTHGDGSAGASGYIDVSHPGQYQVVDVWKAGTALGSYTFTDSFTITAVGRPWPVGAAASYGAKASVSVKCLKLAS
jgi:hypothetical protein